MLKNLSYDTKAYFEFKDLWSAANLSNNEFEMHWQCLSAILLQYIQNQLIFPKLLKVLIWFVMLFFQSVTSPKGFYPY